MIWFTRPRIVMGLVGVISLLGISLPTYTQAQETEFAAAGKPVFVQYCGSCHGREGKGNGPAVSFLSVKPADLTQISKRNNGSFPFWKIFRIIDGREEMRGHGDREMPIWGAEFRADAGSSALAQSQARARVLELVYYLQSLQAK